MRPQRPLLPVPRPALRANHPAPVRDPRLSPHSRQTGGGGYHRGMARYHVRQIALDGNDLDAMIEFWAAALGYELDHRQDNYAVLRDPDGAEPRIFLQKVPEPKAGKNRAHFDVAVPDEQEAVKRLVGLGARVLWREDFQTHYWTRACRPRGERVLCRQLRLTLAAQPTPGLTKRHAPTGGCMVARRDGEWPASPAPIKRPAPSRSARRDACPWRTMTQGLI